MRKGAGSLVVRSPLQKQRLSFGARSLKAESHGQLISISGMSFSSFAQSRACVVYGGYFRIQLSP